MASKNIGDGREAKRLQLQGKIVKLCERAGEEFITSEQAQRNGWDMSTVTRVPEITLIRLHNEIVRKVVCLFVFVENPAVDDTNNQSERDLRHEARVRNSGNTSNGASVALGRATIISVFGSLSRRPVVFT